MGGGGEDCPLFKNDCQYFSYEMCFLFIFKINTALCSARKHSGKSVTDFFEQLDVGEQRYEAKYDLVETIERRGKWFPPKPFPWTCGKYSLCNITKLNVKTTKLNGTHHSERHVRYPYLNLTLKENMEMHALFKMEYILSEPYMYTGDCM